VTASLTLLCCSIVLPNLSPNPDASTVALRAVSLAPVSLAC
jgi:hypothetical protein